MGNYSPWSKQNEKNNNNKLDDESQSSGDEDSAEAEDRRRRDRQSASRRCRAKKLQRLQSARSQSTSAGLGSRSRYFDEFRDDQARDHRQQMRQMNSMFTDPFGAMGGGGMLALPGANGMDRRDQHRRQQQQGQNLAVAERNTFMDPFSHFDSMFSNMRNMMSEMHRSFDAGSSGMGMMNNPNGHVFQQSSYMTVSNTGNGAPKIYQASSSTRSGPGGIKETRRTVRDSERGIEKIAVGHHINDRGHVIERSRENGQMNENQEYINLDEEEAPVFDREYQEKWGRSAMRGLDDRRRSERERHGPIGGRHRQQALPEPKSHRPRKSHRE